MEIRIDQLKLNNLTKEKIHTLLIPIKWIDNTSFHLKILALVCNLYKVEIIKIGSSFLFNNHKYVYDLVKVYGEYHEKISFVKTVKTLIFEKSTVDTNYSLEPIMTNFAIQTVIFMETVNWMFASFLIRSSRENWLQNHIKMNYLIREIIFVYEDGTRICQYENSFVDKIIKRNIKHQTVLILLGIIKFRKVSNLIGKNVMRMITNIVWNS